MSQPRPVSGKIIVGVFGLFVLLAGLLLIWGTVALPVEVPSSGRFPRAIVAAALPEPESEGAKLVQKHCISCHALPDPTVHPAADWPASLADMELRIRTSIMKGAPMPSHDGWRTIEAYLKAHAADAGTALGAK
jgi:cytochrome c5